MAFQQGLSGLSIASKALDAISNNVSNSGTVGYKQAGAQFADVFAASLSAGSSTQVGIGASVTTVAQQFTQGNISTSSSTLDLAVNGQGFFRMSDNGSITYTRNGQFHVDKNGYVVNSSGLRLTGNTFDAKGLPNGVGGDIRLSYGDADPKATTEAGYNVNLDSRSSSPAALTVATLYGTGVPATVGTPLVLTAANNRLTVAVDTAGGKWVRSRERRRDRRPHGLAVGRDCMGLQSLTDHGAESQIGNVMVVHHVKVDPVGAGRNDITHFFTQTGEVG